jgi:VIT1/CCC1 family predicted Fe2+/Mn2+ transporter
MSNFLRLNFWDVVKSLVVAFLTAFITAIYAVIQTGEFPTWEQIQSALMVGLAALLGYLVKNLFTSPSVTP